MNATTVAVDLAKNVFELAAADERWKVVEKSRLTRGQLERWFQNRSVRLVVMEACATAHYWARTLRARGVEVRLLPAKYVRAYVRRNKTDAADALALLEAARSSDITPVAVKSVEQQALQALHRLRSGWMATRTRRINTLRGFCREFGMEVSVGAARGLAQIARLLADEHSAIPALLRGRCRCGRRGQRARQGRRGAHLGVPYSARCRARVPPGAAEPRSSAAAHPVDLCKIGRANYLPMTKTTDWRSYTERMIELCQRLGVKHYVQKNQQPYLPNGDKNPLRLRRRWRALVLIDAGLFFVNLVAAVVCVWHVDVLPALIFIGCAVYAWTLFWKALDRLERVYRAGAIHEHLRKSAEAAHRLPMEGFHLDEYRAAAQRKGAPPQMGPAH